jgi:flavodoxin
MRALVVYDSYFGNTEEVAKAIAGGLKDLVQADVIRASDFDPKRVKGFDFLIIGSPTRAFHETKRIKVFLKGVARDEYEKMKVIAFDTRIATEDIESRLLSRMEKAFGHAAEPMSDIMKKRGGELLIDPVGFYVQDTEGPLKEGEVDRAVEIVRQAIQKEIDKDQA